MPFGIEQACLTTPLREAVCRHSALSHLAVLLSSLQAGRTILATGAKPPMFLL